MRFSYNVYDVLLCELVRRMRTPVTVNECVRARCARFGTKQKTAEIAAARWKDHDQLSGFLLSALHKHTKNVVNGSVGQRGWKSVGLMVQQSVVLCANCTAAAAASRNVSCSATVTSNDTRSTPP